MRMIRLGGGLNAVLPALVSIFLVSFLIHHPNVSPNLYSDIVNFWFREDFRSGRIPYVEAKFEYPPLSGFLAYSAMRLGEGIAAYYSLFSLILLSFAIGTVIVTLKLMERNNSDPSRIYRYLILAPSMVFYLVYNFDIVFVFFTALSLYALLENRTTVSAIATGLGILTKLVNIILLPIFLMNMTNNSSRLRYGVISLGIAAAGNLAVASFNPSLWMETYLHHAGWYLENSWLVYLFPTSSTWGTARLVAVALMVYLLARVYLLRGIGIIERSLLAFAAFLLTSYKYTPQMNIWLLPFFAIIRPELPLFYLFDSFNVGIILLWFSVSDPLAPGSPVQLLSLGRAVTLAIMMLGIVYGAGLKLRLPFINKRTFPES